MTTHLMLSAIVVMLMALYVQGITGDELGQGRLWRRRLNWLGAGLVTIAAGELLWAALR